MSITPGRGAASVNALAVLRNGDLVAGGNFSSSGGETTNGIAQWNGSAWTAIGSGMKRGRDSGTTVAIAILPDDNVVVGGTFDTAGALPCYNIAQCHRSAWTPLGAGIGGTAISAVRAIVDVPNLGLVAGGDFSAVSGVAVKNIASWDGFSWKGVGSGIKSSGTLTVRALAALRNGDLVAAGDFTFAGDVAANRIARWNGSSWIAMGSGMNASVHCLIVLANGDLVAGGAFTSAGGVPANRVARWNGASWVPLGSGVQGSSWASVSALAVLDNGGLVACGDFSTAGGLPASDIAVWNGVSWSAFGSGLQGTPSGEAESFATSLTVLPNGNLVVAGAFTTAGGVPANRIAIWNGSSWAALGSGVNARIYSVIGLANGDVVAAGRFTTAGGVAVERIARWNGLSWSSLGAGIAGTIPLGTFAPEVSSLAVLPNGELVAGGQFTSAGGVSSSFWARWTKTGIPWVARQPSSPAAKAGKSVSVAATCSSGYDFNGPVSFQWHRNGSPIANGPSGASLGGGTVLGASGSLPSPTTDPTATLTITNAQPSDAGSYTVVFSNSCGSVTSLPAVVTIEAACPSDFNNDGLVDDADFSIFAVAYDVLDCADPAMPSGCPADLNGDGLVNDDDFQSFIVSYNAVLCP
jgi:hypothetical protein